MTVLDQDVIIIAAAVSTSSLCQLKLQDFPLKPDTISWIMVGLRASSIIIQAVVSLPPLCMFSKGYLLQPNLKALTGRLCVIFKSVD